MRSSIELRDDGLYWPVIDKACYVWTEAEIHSVEEIFSSCEHTRSIIHAGANVGAYAIKFARKFDQVYAFEPETVNFKCLAINTIEYDNIFLFQSILGCFNQPITLKNNESNNCGTGMVIPQGIIPQITIDSLNLNNIDCIHLDIEGYELFALIGALNTIQKCSPVIVLEWLDHQTNYGIAQSTILNFLEGLGYNKMKRISSDVIFKK